MKIIGSCCTPAEECSAKPFDEFVEAACIELVVSEYLGKHWSAQVDNFDVRDVGVNIQVRGTSRIDGRLIIRKKDKVEDIFVLVVQDCPRYGLAGYILGREAVQMIGREPANRGGGGGACWWIPQKDLHPIEELKDYLATLKP